MTAAPKIPAELSWLAEPLGEAALLALIEARGGTRLYVPHRAVGVELAELIGEDAAFRLCKALGGQDIKVPLAKEWRCRVYRARRMSYSQIALKLGCSEDTVSRMLTAAKMTHVQMSFEGF